MLPSQPIAVWVAALRSGEYEQARDYLAVPYGVEGEQRAFCCMGVATDLIVPVTTLEWGSGDLYQDACYPPPKAHIIFGLGTLKVDGTSPVTEVLAALNDEDRKPFPEIADWIVKFTKVRADGSWFISKTSRCKHWSRTVPCG